MALPKISLRTANFQPAQFQAATFTPQQEDMNLLARSLDKQEQRRREAYDRYSAVEQSFAEARQLLPDNEETNRYITENQQRIQNSIQNYISLGNYGDAINRSKKLATDFMSSPEFVARTKEHKQRTDWMGQLDHSNVDNYIKEYYKDTYGSENHFTYDSDGNITGTSGWEAPLPEQSVSASTIIEQAAKDTRDERSDRASDWQKGDSSTRTSGHSHTTTQVLTADRISETAIAKVMGDASIKQNFIDQFNAGMHRIKKLQKALNNETDPDKRSRIQSELDAFKDNFYVNDAPISSANDYIKHVFSPTNNEIKNAAYNYRTTNSGSGNITDGNSSQGNGLGTGASQLEGSGNASTKGANRRANGRGSSEPSRGVRPKGKK